MVLLSFCPYLFNHHLGKASTFPLSHSSMYNSNILEVIYLFLLDFMLVIVLERTYGSRTVSKVVFVKMTFNDFEKAKCWI